MWRGVISDFKRRGSNNQVLHTQCRPDLPRERGKEGLGRINIRWQYGSKNVLARPLGSPHAVAVHQSIPTWGRTRLPLEPLLYFALVVSDVGNVWS